jgi:hypothetical protein
MLVALRRTPDPLKPSEELMRLARLHLASQAVARGGNT